MLVEASSVAEHDGTAVVQAAADSALPDALSAQQDLHDLVVRTRLSR